MDLQIPIIIIILHISIIFPGNGDGNGVGLVERSQALGYVEIREVHEEDRVQGWCGGSVGDGLRSNVDDHRNDGPDAA